MPLITESDLLSPAPEWENYIELKLNWLRDNGCIKKSFEGQAGDEQLEWMMENYFAEDKKTIPKKMV